MQPIISCGFLILRRDPNLSFLLMKHANRWDLPKGHLDPGETLEQCALRELTEETGISGDHIDIVPEFKFVHDYLVKPKKSSSELRPKRLVVYMGYLVEPVEIQATEHLGYEWFDWKPPHRIQEKTIDPLLQEAEKYLLPPG